MRLRRPFLPLLLALALLAGGRAGVGLVGCGPGALASAPGFVAGLEDLPLMPGLVEVAGSAIAFDVPEGRIVEVYAEGAVPKDRVLAFYGETLPQLGWTKGEGTVYQREGEVLGIEVAEEGEGVTVRFSVSPAATVVSPEDGRTRP